MSPSSLTREVKGNTTRSDDPLALIDIPKANSWVSHILPSIYKRQGGKEIQISLTATVYFYPAHVAWLTVKTLPQSPAKTVMQYDLYACTSRSPKCLKGFIQKLKDTTSAENMRLLSTQTKLMDNALSLNDCKSFPIIHRKLTHSP